MTKQELERAFEIAKGDRDLDFDGLEVFDGYGLWDFKPVHTTLTNVARLIRWQCGYIFGGWDFEELAQLANAGRRRFIIIGE